MTNDLKITINSFKMTNLALYFDFIQSNGYNSIYLKVITLKPYTEPAFLLVTEDGQRITDPEQRVYWVYKEDLDTSFVLAKDAKKLFCEQGFLIFSNESASTAYINHHAKTMSVADLEALDMPSEGVYKHSEFYFIPKSKVNGQQS